MSSRVLHDKHATALDKLIAQIQTCLVEKASCFEDGRDNLLNQLNRLAINIQAVRQKDTVIAQVRSSDFWQNATIDSLEHARSELRGIMKYRQGGGEPEYTPATNTQDGKVQQTERPFKIPDSDQVFIIRKRAKEVLEQMVQANPTLQKIQQGQAVLEHELTSLTSAILTSHPGVSLEVLNEFYGRTATQLDITIR